MRLRAFLILACVVTASWSPTTRRTPARAGAPLTPIIAQPAGARGPLVTPSGPGVLLATSLAPAVATGAARPLGALARGTILSVAIALRPRDPEGLRAFAQAISDPASPDYGRYLSYAELQDRFGPDRGAGASILAWLQDHGLQASMDDATLIQFQASAAAAGALFGTHINNYRASNGDTFYAPAAAPAVPASLAGFVQAIVGLDNQALQRPHLHAAVIRGPATTLTGPDPRDVYGPVGGYTPAALRRAYDTAGLISGGIDGRGQTIDLYELDSYAPNNLLAFEQQYQLPTGNVTPITCAMNGSTGKADCTKPLAAPVTTLGETEVESDIEVLRAMAPATAIHVWTTTNNSVGEIGLWQQIIQRHDASIVSTSWGLCEPQRTPSSMDALDTLFQTAVSEGIGIYAASGDTGSYDCGDTTLAVDYPAASPSITAVGGTNLGVNGDGSYGGESAWNDLSYFATPPWDGGGGGYSSRTPAPAYQPFNHAWRSVPDVSAGASPSTGYSIYTVDYSGSPNWMVIGGTSLSTPLWAAIAAQANQVAAARGHADIGFANPLLSQLGQGTRYTSVFHDVTQGNNDTVDTDAAATKHYPAAPGYDLATGWGSPIGAQLVAGLSGAAPPHAALSQTALDFGAQQPGSSSAVRTVTLTNDGQLPLQLGTLTLGDTADFALTTSCGGATLAPGASCPIGASFRPAASTGYTTAISISDDASDSPQQIVLTGSGAPAAATATISATSTSSPTATAIGTSTTAPTSTPIGTALAPDLAIRLRRAGSFRPGALVQYLIGVRNDGGGATSGSILITATFPTGATPLPGGLTLPAPNWTCSIQGVQLSCQSPSASGIMVPGSRISLGVSVQLDPALPHPSRLIVRANVQAANDGDPRNDTVRSIVAVP